MEIDKDVYIREWGNVDINGISEENILLRHSKNLFTKVGYIKQVFVVDF